MGLPARGELLVFLLPVLVQLVHSSSVVLSSGLYNFHEHPFKNMLEVVMMMEGLMVLALLVVTQPLLHGPYRPRLHTINNAWKVSQPPTHAFINQQRSTALFLQNDMEDGVRLTALVDDEEVGMFLHNAIMQWLDEEYIPQDIHRILGEAVQRIYVKGRKDGVTDLGENTTTMTLFLLSCPNDDARHLTLT